VNREELVREVGKLADQPQWMVNQSLNALIEVLSRNLATEEPVTIRGFGRFDLGHHGPMKGRNPRTGEPYESPARVTVRFLPCKALKERVNP
jgi:nucleoid DNA-binding protein